MAKPEVRRSLIAGLVFAFGDYQSPTGLTEDRVRRRNKHTVILLMMNGDSSISPWHIIAQTRRRGCRLSSGPWSGCRWWTCARAGSRQGATPSSSAPLARYSPVHANLTMNITALITRASLRAPRCIRVALGWATTRCRTSNEARRHQLPSWQVTSTHECGKMAWAQNVFVVRRSLFVLSSSMLW